MAYNDRKILNLLLSELGRVPERCTGYREDLSHLVGDVLNLERDHAISKIAIVQKISEQVNTVGVTLHKARQSSKNDKGGSK